MMLKEEVLLLLASIKLSKKLNLKQKMLKKLMKKFKKKPLKLLTLLHL
jgi:hypothetical protein